MDSIILDLQRLAYSSTSNIADVLRLAFIAARKLELDDFQRWVHLELNGYKDVPDVPAYRTVTATIKHYSPYHGWTPLFFENTRFHDQLTECKITNSVEELQDMIRRPNENGILTKPFDTALAVDMMKEGDFYTPPTRVIGPTQIAGMLDAVRNAVLEWALKLEEAGILGKGLRFNAEEKEKAGATTEVNIEKIFSIAGNVSGDTTHAINAQVVGSAIGSQATVTAESIQGFLRSVTNSPLDAELKTKIAEACEAIIALDISDHDKKDAVDDLKKLTDELGKPNAEPSRIRQLWGRIKDIAPTVASMLKSAESIIKLAGELS